MSATELRASFGWSTGNRVQELRESECQNIVNRVSPTRSMSSSSSSNPWPALRTAVLQDQRHIRRAQGSYDQGWKERQDNAKGERKDRGADTDRADRGPVVAREFGALSDKSKSELQWALVLTWQLHTRKLGEYTRCKNQ